MLSQVASGPAPEAEPVPDEIRAQLGFVPLIYQEPARRPSLLSATWDDHRRTLLGSNV